MFTICNYVVNPEWTKEVDDLVPHYIDIEIPLEHAEILEQCQPVLAEMKGAIATIYEKVCTYTVQR